ENIQEWKCLAASAAGGSIFSSAAAGSGCAIPIPVRWPAARMRAEALVAAATAPINLTASVSGSTVVFNWTASPGATSYIIQAGSAPGQSNLANFSTGNTNTTFSASGVGAGQYYVRVLGANAAGASGPSADVLLSVGPGACSSGPSASPGLSASVSGSTITFAWLAASGATGYILQAGSSAGASNLASISVGNALSYTATGVPNGTYYV